MAGSGLCFVEWKEQFVSKERGNRVVHYFLKDAGGKSVLAVVGTERSIRHMFYVVSEEYLSFQGADDSIQAGYRWKSRREVVNWLTSMLSKQHRHGDRSKSPKDAPISGISAQQSQLTDYKGRLARNSKGHASDIVWSGVAWICGKQLKHYPAFCRNGITITIQSFVYVMAEEENRHLAYLEDMYEDRKGQKKVKVRWFHYNQEVMGVISLRNAHPKEVFITPYAQVISVECVDGPAVVLSSEHYEKCEAALPHDLLARVHLCSRQFKSNRVKVFKLSKLRGYFDQPIFSCLGSNFFGAEELSLGDNVKVGAKRSRSCRGRQGLPCGRPNMMLSRKLVPRKYVQHHPCDNPPFKANEKIEFLCQDSGIRGCWFRCTVLRITRRQIKVQYDDIEDEDGCGNLEEWIPAFRPAMPDRFGMRYSGRPTIRPAYPHTEAVVTLKAGAPVDAWWSDGWWEGVLTGTTNAEDDNLQVYVPSEDLSLIIQRNNLRVSRDWVGDRWVDVESNPNLLSAISAPIGKEKSDGFPLSFHEVPTNIELCIAEEKKPDLADSAPLKGLPKDNDCVGEENNCKHISECHEKDMTDLFHNGDDDNVDVDVDFDVNHDNCCEVIKGKLEIEETSNSQADM